MSLQVWLPLNGDLTQQGLSNVTVINNGATVDNNGKIGKCYKVNSNARISFPSFSWMTMKPQNNFSFFCWVKGTTTGQLFACSAWELRLAPTYIQIHLAGNGQYPARYNGIFDANTWYHLGFTWSGVNGKLLLYLNGSKVAESNVPSSANFDIASTFDLPYDGPRYLNDVRIYDHCLSIKEVKELAKGLVLHYRLVGPGQENLVTSLSAGKQTSIDGTYAVHTSKTNADTYFYANLSSSLSPGDKVTVSCDVSGFASNNYQWNFSFWNQRSGLAFWLKNGHCSQTFTVPSGVSASNKIIFDDNGTKNGFTRGDSIIYIKNFKIERGSAQTPWCPNSADPLYSALGYDNNIEYDCSGYSNNGIKSGTIICDSDTPRYMTSYKFNGSSCIKNNKFYFDSSIWTVSLWYKYNTAPTAYEGLICLSKNNGSDSNKKLAIMPNSNYIWFKAEKSSISISSLKVGEWCHLAVVSNGESAIIYENGVQKGTTIISSFVTNAYDLVVGARASSAGATTTSVYSKGNISDVRIYATALSAEDIKELYQISATIDKGGNVFGYDFIESGENSIFKEGIVDFDKIIEYNEDRLSENEKVSIFANSIEAYNYYEF